MGMFALIEDTRAKLLAEASEWAETKEAGALLQKIDALERLADRWSVEVPAAAEAFSNAASEAQDELDELRRDAVDAYAKAHSDDRNSDEWFEAWDNADNYAPEIKPIMDLARRDHAGDAYLERFGG